MKILILSASDNSIGPMAQAYLLSFDYKMQVHSAATDAVEAIREEAIHAMAEVNQNISFYAPHAVADYLNEEWDYVVTFGRDEKNTFPNFLGKVKDHIHLDVEDPVNVTGTPEFVKAEYHRVRGELYLALRKLYRERLIDETSCSCGANYFCQCE